jgi:G:T-mismatch repair DNA endonuclease (very short patch repair protein)
MGIKRIIGPFDKKGNTINKTKVLCECEVCKNTWRSNIKSLKSRNDFVCKTCRRYGPPLSAEDVIATYGCVINADETSPRNGVSENSLVVVVCCECNNAYDVLFRSIKKQVRKTGDPNYWRCFSCAHRQGHGIPLIFPDDVDDILYWDEETLGDAHQLMSTSVVYYHCNKCNNVFSRQWQHHPKETVCLRCIRTEWLTSEEFSEKYKNTVLNRSGGHMSSGHQRLKDKMLEVGLSGFESEQFIGRDRVDEVDYTNKIVIEFFGSFWHADPRRYKPDELMFSAKKRGDILAKDIWERDQERLDRIKDSGYEVIIVWEDDFLDDPDETAQKLFALIGEK